MHWYRTFSILLLLFSLPLAASAQRGEEGSNIQPPEGVRTAAQSESPAPGERPRAGGQRRREGTSRTGEPGTRTGEPGTRTGEPGTRPRRTRPARTTETQPTDSTPAPTPGSDAATPSSGTPGGAPAAPEGTATPEAPTGGTSAPAAPAEGEAAPPAATGSEAAPGEAAPPDTTPGGDNANPEASPAEGAAAGAPATATPETAPAASNARPVSNAVARREEATPAPAAAAQKAKPAPVRKPGQVIPTSALGWSEVFERQALGFDRDTPVRIARDLSASLDHLARSPFSLLRSGMVDNWGFCAGLVALALFLGFGLTVERRRSRSWRRLWLRLRAAARHSELWRAVVAIIQRASLPFTALVLWTMGALLVAAEGAAVSLVQSLLGVWAGYRLADESACQLLDGTKAGRRPLYRALHRLFVFAVVWLDGWLLMDAARYREDAIALWLTGGHLFLVLGLFAFLLQRDRLLGLLPESESGAYRTLLRITRALYYPLIYASLLVSLLWVIGYQRLASLFLGRSWAVVGICVVALLAYRFGFQLLKRWVDDDPTTVDQRDEVLASGQRLLEIAAGLIALALSLKVLGIWQPISQLLGKTLLSVGAFRLTGHAIWASALIFIGTALLSRWTQAMLAFRVYPRVGVGRGEAYALNRLLHYALVAASVLLVLNTLGLSPSSLAIVLGGLSVGIGFGLQDIANNIASGLILLTSRQVRQGDIITVANQQGTVREVNLRSTVVTTGDNVDLLIPNSKLLGDTLINWTHSGTVIRAKVPFGVSYQANPREVLDLALEIARNHPAVLQERPPTVWLTEMADNSLNFELCVWIDMARHSRPQVVTEIYCQLFDEFNARGVEIPFPQRDLHLRSGVPWEEIINALKSRGDVARANGHADQPEASGSGGKTKALSESAGE